MSCVERVRISCGILSTSLMGETRSGSDDTIKLVGAFSDLKNPAASQSQPREPSVLVVT